MKQSILKTKHLISCAITLLLLGNILLAQKPMAERGFEINPQLEERSEIIENKRIDLNTGLPLSIYNLHYKVKDARPEEMALQYLQEQGAQLGLPKGQLDNLKHYFTRSSDIGHTVRFQQVFGEIPVSKSEIVVTIDPNNFVTFISSTYKKEAYFPQTNTVLSEMDARQIAENHIRLNSETTFERTEMLIFHHPVSKQSILVYDVLTNCPNPLGEWHVFVDVETGEVVKAVDEAVYDHGHGDDDESETSSNSTRVNGNVWTPPMALPAMPATGTGNVFDPDPLLSAGVTYGTGGYTDNGDANSADLTSQIFNETLLDITLTGGNYTLYGIYAGEVDWDTPNDGIQSQTSSAFNFNRSDAGFEAVNIYYHVDASMRYINTVLNCPVAPQQNGGVAEFDPHGAGGADNSYYTGGTQRISFGEGCVDDGEDSDVIHHELFHGIHDWVTGGNLSNTQGLSEGSADYWAVSYNRGSARTQFTVADPQWNWVFNWDGHNECWGGRVTNYGGTYPDDVTAGCLHTCGQIWSTCIMGIWDQLGQQTADKLMIEGLSMTGGSSNQDDAANAVYQAAINLGINGPDLQAIHAQLSGCGYTLPSLPGPPVANFEADQTEFCVDTSPSVSFNDLSTGDPVINSWSWTFPGGTPATSTSPNPTVTYSSAGIYDVTLQVCNGNAECDVITLTNYITVISAANCPNDCHPTFFDSGGSTGQYQDDENMEWTFCPLDPTCEKIEMTFTSVDIEATTGTGIQDGCWDFLSIYNGASTGSPVLAETLCGELEGSGDTPSVASSLLQAGDVFTSTSASGCLTITFSSDASVTNNGWSADLICVGACSCPTFTSVDSPPASVACDGSIGLNALTSNNASADLSFNWSISSGAAFANLNNATSPTANITFDNTSCSAEDVEISLNILCTIDNSVLFDGVVGSSSVQVCADAYGCTDPTACNFDSTASCDDASCQVLDACGVCGGSGTAGCNDPSACNFNSAAACDDGTCLFDDCVGVCGGTATEGCTDPTACNFDSTADCNDGSCLVDDCAGVCGGTATEGCTDPTACNFDSTADCNDGSCLVDDCAGVCGGTATEGCTDPTACNFDSTADCNDGSCLVDDCAGVCGGTATEGCTDPTACNFDSTADCNDGSCLVDDCAGVCGGTATEGCTDPTACNFDSTADCNDGSCESISCLGGGISSTIYQDMNENGSFETGEPFVQGVTVNAVSYGTDGILGTADDMNFNTTTNTNGYFLLNGMVPGNYQVTLDVTTPYFFTNGTASSIFNTVVVNASISAIGTGGFVPVYQENEGCDLDIPLNTGWNIISSYCIPDDADMPDVFNSIAGSVIQVKDLQNVYVPQLNYNTMDPWDITQGYQVKTNQTSNLNINGANEADPLVDQIPLNSGWNIIAYWLKGGDADPNDVFDDYSPNVIQVKNLYGAYVPALGANSMGNMTVTEGYQVKMANADVMSYDPADGVYLRPTDDAAEIIQPEHFVRDGDVHPNNSTVVIISPSTNQLNYGDEIGIFSEDGMLVGAGVYQGGHIGMLVYGAEASNEQSGVDQDSNPGILTGEKYDFRLWDKLEQNEKLLDLEIMEGPNNFEKDALTIAAFKTNTGIEDISPIEINAVPNPVSDQVIFNISLNQNSKNIKIQLFSMDGKLIEEIVNDGELGSGLHQVPYNVSHLADGIYMYKLIADDKVISIEKLTVAK